MTPQSSSGKPARRILVALNESHSSGNALEAAAKLASDLSAELCVFFVEEEDFVRAASLPVTSIVTYLGAEIEPLSTHSMARSFKVRAQSLQLRVAQTATKLQIPWNFSVCKGLVANEILQKVGASDILAMGMSTRKKLLRESDPCANALAERAPCSVLIVRQTEHSHGDVVVASKGRSEAVSLGRMLSRSLNRPLRILPLQDGRPDLENIERELQAHMADSTTRHGMVLNTVADDREAILGRLKRLSPGFLIIDKDAVVLLNLTPEEITNELGLEGLVIIENRPAEVAAA